MPRAVQVSWILSLGLAVSVAIAQTTPNLATLRQRAIALEQQGKSSEAEAAWHEFSVAQPSNPEPYAHLGLLAARQQHYKQAIPLYRKALSFNPNVPGLRLNLGLALFKNGDLKEAIPEFQELLKTAQPDSPDEQRLTILIGMSYYGLAQYAEAVPYLRKSADRDTTSLPLRLALAHSYMWSKQYRPVLDVYKEILTIDPDSAEADMLAGEALDEMKDNAGSTQMFRAAVKANPKQPNAHFGLAYLLWTQKQYPEAAQEFQAELKNDPNHVQALIYLGDSYMQLNRQKDAEPLLRKAIKLDPTFPLSHLDLGIIASDAGRNVEAMRELLAAEKLAPNEVDVHWRLGRLYRATGKKQQAQLEFDKAKTLNKAANEELYKKIANGKNNPPPAPVDPTGK